MSLTSANTCAGGRAISAERVRVLIERSLEDRHGRLNPGAYNARMAEPDTPPRIIAENRRARHDYFIEERLEAGPAPEGWGGKALRAGGGALAEAEGYIRHSATFLVGAHIPPLNTGLTHK